jgi:hypothetical protein
MIGTRLGGRKFGEEEYRMQETESRRQEEEYGMQSVMPPARSFCDLVVWQKAHLFVLAVYRFTAGFPSRKFMDLAHR